jgi:Transposase, Mutator family
MSLRREATGSQRSLSRPLCRSFVVAQLERAHHSGRRAQASLPETSLFAVGSTARSWCVAHCIGSKPHEGTSDFHVALAALRSRGVQSVRLLVSAEPEALEGEAQAVFPSAVLLPSVGQLVAGSLERVPAQARARTAVLLASILSARSLGDARIRLAALETEAWAQACPTVLDSWREALVRLAPLYAASPGLRRIVFAADETVQRVSQTLRRALARHGPFEDEAAALAFVSDVLDRVDRGFGLTGSDTCLASPQGGLGAVRRSAVVWGS